MKMYDHVTCLLNSLNITGLDCDLFSCTRHGRNDKGCSFFLGASKMHLTFPNFTISDDIPANEDLRVQLEPLSKEDWEIPNSIYEGTSIHNQNVDHFERRLDMVDEILRGRVTMIHA